MEKVFYGSNLYKKYAARIAFYNINRQVPTGETPIVYDQANQRVVYLPNGGYAGHYLIYDYMEDKGWDIPEMSEQAHGYYYPDQAGRFQWYTKPYLTPNPNLEEAIRSGIRKSTPQPKLKTPLDVPLCKFKWACDPGDEKPTDNLVNRPVIYWVDQDTVYLGRPHGAHYEIYEIMEDDGFDPSGSTGPEVHGYWNWTQGNFKWYEPGAYGYEANRLPEGNEEDRIRATIEAEFAKNGAPVTASRTAAVLPLKKDYSNDDHGGGVAWSYDNGVVHVTSQEGYHYELNSEGDVIGRFEPDSGRVLFYNSYRGNRNEALEKDIIDTLRAHASEILAGIEEPTGFDSSVIGDQGWDDPYNDFFKLVD